LTEVSILATTTPWAAGAGESADAFFVCAFSIGRAIQAHKARCARGN
jgi:hypothetical protein